MHVRHSKQAYMRLWMHQYNWIGSAVKTNGSLKGLVAWWEMSGTPQLKFLIANQGKTLDQSILTNKGNEMAHKDKTSTRQWPFEFASVLPIIKHIKKLPTAHYKIPILVNFSRKSRAERIILEEWKTSTRWNEHMRTGPAAFTRPKLLIDEVQEQNQLLVCFQ